MGEATQLTLEPFANFDAAANGVLRFLHLRLGLSTWMIVRDQGGSGIILTAHDQGYGITPGQACHWRGDFGMQFPAQRAVSHTAETGELDQLLLTSFAPVRAYVAAPIYLADGDLFGALCAIDSQPARFGLEHDLPLVELAARLLASLLELELKAQHATRRADHLDAEVKLDPLTGLYNRRGWEILLEREEARCARYGNTGAVISIDLDDLKRVNDSEGHTAGDRLIASAARCLSQVIRGADVVARLGGDEFGVLLVEARTQDAEATVKRIRERFAMEHVSASVGWAGREPLSTLFTASEKADAAMYVEKRLHKAPRLDL